MIKSLFLAFVVFMIGGFFYITIRNGFFKHATIEIGNRPSMHLLYKEFVGPYDKVLPTLQEVEKWAHENKISCALTFGEYLEDPNVVEMERLHSNVGCLLDSNWTSDLKLPEGFQVKEIPARKYVLGDFAGSPALGPYKVYGKAQDFIQEKNLEPIGPVIEVYEVSADQTLRTLYLFPVKER